MLAYDIHFNLQILHNGGPRFVVLYGSNGTGKTIVLFQCLVMLISKLELEEKSFEVLVMVGTDSIKDPICGTESLRHGLQYCKTANCDGPELLYDLKAKYLDSFYQLKYVQPIRFEKACQGESNE